MRIVSIHTDFCLYWPARLQALSEKLTSDGHEFSVIEISGKGNFYAFAKPKVQEGLSWTCLFPDKKMEEISSERISKILEKKLDELNPDVIMAGAIAFPSGAIATRWAKKRGKGIVIFDDARMLDVPRNFIVNYIKKIIYRNVDAIFCPTPDWNQTFFYWGFKQEQLFYGMDVVDNNFWKNDLSDGVSKLKFPEKYILSIGRQVNKKNFLFLIKAFDQYVKSSDLNISLVLVGDGEEHICLENYVKDNNIRNVHFFPFMSQLELREVYQNADLFVLPSLYGETWGLVVNEAMASGLPIAISSQVGCSSTLVGINENGYLFSPANLNELTDIFKHFFSLSDMCREEMGKISVERIQKWGLSRFVKGACDAIFYASVNKKKSNYFDRFILKLWNGRYNPV